MITCRRTGTIRQDFDRFVREYGASGWYAPVIVSENGKRVVKPMRYQYRPAGKPSANAAVRDPG